MKQDSIHFGAPKKAGRPRLVLSFSFGRTSARMAQLCMEKLQDQYEMLVIVANTGEEREESLAFGHQCDTHFGWDMTWVEAVINPEMGEGTRHRVVSYETATRMNTRNGPFEAVIQKYGIPGPGRAHCTRELKANAIKSYLDSIGWTDYTIAIGLRPDEPRRVDEEQMRRANLGHKVKFIYPLIDFWYHDKQDVNDWWEEQPFNLQLREHEGNCAWCWKKSDPKHYLLMRENPGIYAFPATMEALYPRLGAEFAKDPTAKDRVFFRKRRSAEMLMAEAQAVTSDQPTRVLRKFAENDPGDDACDSSCEPYPMLDFQTEDVQ